MRKASVVRNTAETRIRLELDLDGTGKSSVTAGCGFLEHMLTLMSRHGRFDLRLEAAGDTNVDYHHLTEDVGIALGQALREALGDCRGICRYGAALLPMDETLMQIAVDISGRGLCVSDLACPAQKVGDFDTELGNEFFAAFARRAGITLHICQIRGGNSHHILEAAFKGAGRALRAAVRTDAAASDEIPSTKGVL